MTKVELANELLKLHGIDVFDTEGYVNDAEIEALINTFSKYKPEEK